MSAITQLMNGLINPFLMLSAFTTARLNVLPLASAEPGAIRGRYSDYKTDKMSHYWLCDSRLGETLR
jgi:hypothetical protein